MPDPSVIRDNKARNNNYANFANFLGGGSKPKISTTTPANKIQSNQFTAGHTMDPGQRGGTSRTGGVRGTTLDPGQRGGKPRIDTTNRRVPNPASVVKPISSGTLSDPSKRGMDLGRQSASAGMAGFNPNVGSAMPKPAAPVQAPRRDASSGLAGFNPNVGGPKTTVQASAPSMWGQNQQMPAGGSEQWDSMQAMVEREFGPGQSIFNPTYDEQRFPTIVPPVVAPTDPLGVNFDMGMLEEAIAMQPPPANTMGTILSVPAEAYEIPTTTTTEPAPVMPPAGDTGGGAYDYGGSGFGGGTGNLGTFDPFASDEYLRFGSELAGLENQEGMVDESRGFWDISQDRKWDEVMRQIPGLFNQRGMADSGLLNRANALALGDREFETAVRDWMDENQRSAINRGQMAAEQELMRSQLQNMFDMFGSGAITPMNQPTMNQMDPMGVFNQTADAIAQGPRNYYGTNPTMDQLNAFNAGTAGMSADQKDALSRLFASKAGVI